VLFIDAAPIEIHVLQDTDLVLRETFAEELNAVAWAQAYADRLREHGWHDSPESSAA
jgi:hypothetical protein